MALDDITLNDGQAVPVAHDFSYIQTVGSRVVRADMAAPPEEPLLLTLAHTTGQVKGEKVASHLMRIDATILDTDGITPHSANIRLMSDVPPAVLSDALADDLAAYIRNWATSANVRLWLRGSVG